MAKVDLNSFRKQMDRAKSALESLPKAAHEQFVKATPVRSGRARRSTRLQNDTIVADYPYSQQLDQGSSRQAPRGMTEPTEVWIQQEVERRLKGI